MEHANADGLSRLPLPDVTAEGQSPEATIFNITQIEHLPITAAQVRHATQKDPILQRVLQFVQQGWPSEVNSELTPFRNRAQELCVEDNCLLWGARVIVPTELRQRVLEELHDTHPGITRMKAIARSYVWWPQLDKDLETLTKSCMRCLSVKQAPGSAPLHPWTWPSMPWQRVHVDYAGPFLNKMFFIVVDAHSKWPEVYDMPSTTSQSTIDVLRHLFAAYGLPLQLVSDNGPQFISTEFTRFLEENGVKHIRSAPYHPASNGLAERFVRSFKEAMKAAGPSPKFVCYRLENFLLANRSTPHGTTGRTPASLFLRRDLRTRLDLLKPSCCGQVLDKQATQIERREQHSRARDFVVGQTVMARNYGPGEKWIPGVIHQKQGPMSYIVDTDKGLWKRHVEQLQE